MGIFNFWKKKPEKLLITKITSPEEIRNYPKVWERTKQNLMGQLTAEKLKNKQLIDQKKKAKPKVADILAKQQRAIELAPYVGGFSWKKMFTLLNQGKKFKVVSYNFIKNFGYLNDVATLRDGRWALFVENEIPGGFKVKPKKIIKPILTGATTKDLFTNFRGLINSVNNGYFIVNLDENGRPFENKLEKDVPRIIADANGKHHISQNNYAPFIEQLMEIDDVITDQDAIIRTYEETLNEMHLNKNIEQTQTRYHKNRADTSEKEMVGAIDEANQMNNRFRDLEKNHAISENEREIDQKRNKHMENTIDAVLLKLSSNLSKTEFQKVKGMFMDIISWHTGVSSSSTKKGLTMEELTNLVAVLSKDVAPQQPIQPTMLEKPEEKEKVSFL